MRIIITPKSHSRLSVIEHISVWTKNFVLVASYLNCVISASNCTSHIFEFLQSIVFEVRNFFSNQVVIFLNIVGSLFKHILAWTTFKITIFQFVVKHRVCVVIWRQNIQKIFEFTLRFSTLLQQKSCEKAVSWRYKPCLKVALHHLSG